MNHHAEKTHQTGRVRFLLSDTNQVECTLGPFHHSKVVIIVAICVHILNKLLRINPYTCQLGEARGSDLIDWGGGVGENRSTSEPPTHHSEADLLDWLPAALSSLGVLHERQT